MKLANQFVVPVISDGAIASMVVLALSLQVAPGSSDTVFSREPILRDRMLRVMLDHANAGGFSGAFTGTRRMDDLRRALIEAARPILGDVLNDVLITEIARQDI
ncbi:flagellar basal body-associated protein FliL [Oceaniovalibus guishaninsula JLT2003]|uniref:Flagellar basal body-associated protein FliL n=1 Tax=Oceaniovalibus guishaninsula JLT2003 TaxID=1231392 RepID=K2HAS0_9RHOB|nr:flagellar basal body-associated protein FliL [Oceaniovalibus guishaninsula JLT2003]